MATKVELVMKMRFEEKISIFIIIIKVHYVCCKEKMNNKVKSINIRYYFIKNASLYKNKLS